ncbi:Hypp3187 [Branchiostoma lanceolatum]|uniref:Hypp3187 protein n=1 Tax=Branchiostoma lanceolatum TaxID=7740 RepID=A0A8K0A026_BRALA|nr:Hypp3187 [Branchiostoma lanceolatum]
MAVKSPPIFYHTSIPHNAPIAFTTPLSKLLAQRARSFLCFGQFLHGSMFLMLAFVAMAVGCSLEPLKSPDLANAVILFCMVVSTTAITFTVLPVSMAASAVKEARQRSKAPVTGPVEVDASFKKTPFEDSIQDEENTALLKSVAI